MVLSIHFKTNKQKPLNAALSFRLKIQKQAFCIKRHKIESSLSPGHLHPIQEAVEYLIQLYFKISY